MFRENERSPVLLGEIAVRKIEGRRFLPRCSSMPGEKSTAITRPRGSLTASAVVKCPVPQATSRICSSPRSSRSDAMCPAISEKNRRAPPSYPAATVSKVSLNIAFRRSSSIDYERTRDVGPRPWPMMTSTTPARMRGRAMTASIVTRSPPIQAPSSTASRGLT
jgi:hypothetical protein